MRYQGYWAGESAMTAKEFCARMGEVTVTRVDLAPDAIWEVTCVSAGIYYVATAPTARQAYQMVADRIQEDDG